MEPSASNDLHVAVLHGNFQNRRKTPAETRRKSGLCELYVLDGAGVEDREKAEEVGRVVDRGVVEQDEILIRTAAPNVKAAHTLGAGLDSGKKLHGFHQVDFAQEDRRLLNLGDGDVDNTHPRLFLDRIQLARPLPLYRLAFPRGRGFRAKSIAKVPVQADCQGIATKPDVRNHNSKRIRRQGQTEETVAIGDGALAQGGFVQGGADELLAIGGIFDVPADRVFRARLRMGVEG